MIKWFAWLMGKNLVHLYMYINSNQNAQQVYVFNNHKKLIIPRKIYGLP